MDNGHGSDGADSRRAGCRYVSVKVLGEIVAVPVSGGVTQIVTGHGLDPSR